MKLKLITSLLFLYTFYCLAENVDLRLRISNRKSEESIITKANLDSIKKFIMKTGKTQTYCNMFNNNPFHSTQGYEFYLSPDTGQQNSNCDPDKSDFNFLTIRNQKPPFNYHRVDFRDSTYVYIEVSWPKENQSASSMRKFVEDAMKEIMIETK